VDWPPKSPDLNKIERIWELLKEDVEALRVDTRVNQLHRELIKVKLRIAWRALPQSEIDKECRDFKNKLTKCRDNGGKNNFYGKGASTMFSTLKIGLYTHLLGMVLSFLAHMHQFAT
jgi:hypothetical protein